MLAQFEIVADRVETVFAHDGRRRHVRMLALRDCDREHPLQRLADFILEDSQARRFPEVFRHSSVGRLVTLFLHEFHNAGFGGRLRVGGELDGVH